MGTLSLELGILMLLLLVNGGLAMAEMAIVSARRTRLQQRADAGDVRAQAALTLASDPNRFLSTVQIGITLVGILAGAFGGATLAETLAARLDRAGVAPRYSEAVAVGLVVLSITYLSLVVGELVPKRLALQHPEAIATRVARPMRGLSLLAAPAVAVLSASTTGVLRLLRVPAHAPAPATEEDITALLRESTAAGVFEAVEQELVTSVFRLADRRVGELMTPRPSVVWLDADDPFAVNWQAMAASPHTLFPLCRGDLDAIVGIVSVKDVAARLVAGEAVDLAALAREALFVPETGPALPALERFRQAGCELAVVVDEYGGTAGLLTLTDVLEALVGDLPLAGEPNDPQMVQRADGSWLFDGLLPVEEMKEALGLDQLPQEDEYQTLAGFVMLQLGRIPAPADAFVWDQYRFEVVDMDGNRVDKVLVAPHHQR
jgi:putative hemolysin